MVALVHHPFIPEIDGGRDFSVPTAGFPMPAYPGTGGNGTRTGSLVCSKYLWYHSLYWAGF